MAQINKPSDYFNTKLYTGTGAEQSITGVGFQPDWVWTKSRTSAYNHNSYDSVRGANKTLYQDLANAEYVGTQGVKSFDSDGFTVGTDVAVNQLSANLVAWNWLAGGTASSNSDGSITSNVSANTTSGFSIVSYTGTGSLATVGHGLGVTPKMIIVKTRGSAGDWSVYHSSLGNTKNLKLNTNAAEQTSINYWNNTSPTSSVFTVNDEGNVNGSSVAMIAYCFAEKKGFSKFGTYTGNASTNGPFIYTGFKPAWVMWKRTDAAGNDWDIYDTARDTYNLAFKELIANASSAESSSTVLALDILSNGFKLKTSNANGNASGGTYIYMAFAENPLVTTGKVPATAR